MAKKIVVEAQEWLHPENRFKYCEELEDGNILFFEIPPFPFPQEEIDFLLKQRQSGTTSRKNIAYKPQIDKITNHETAHKETAIKLKEILRSYSDRVTEFLSTLIAPYTRGWKQDYASFRPFQEKERKLRLRARNDLLHFDAFPTRPLHGSRILRFFTNINPAENRVWITSEGFAKLAKEFAGIVPIPDSNLYSLKSRLSRKIKKIARFFGLKIPLRSPYDSFMLQMHHFLKENSEFQARCPKDRWEFPPLSCWAVFTDEVSHAALSGQYALEQTFIIPQNVLLCPEKSPVCVLERLSGKNLIDPELLKKVF